MSRILRYSVPIPSSQNKDEEEVQVHADDLIMFLQLAQLEEGQTENKYELSLMTATQGSGVAGGKRDAEKTQTQLNKVRFASLSVNISPRCC